MQQTLAVFYYFVILFIAVGQMTVVQYADKYNYCIALRCIVSTFQPIKNAILYTTMECTRY